MKKEKLRKERNKGITLIALVITIIVLLILAGVTIATLTGDNGILAQANKAKTQTTKASAKEQVEVEVVGSYGANGKLDNDTLKNNLNNIKGIAGVPDTITDLSFPLTITVDGIDIDISKNGEVSYAFNAEEWDKTACKESSFLWLSDDPDSGETYHTIVGYADSITNETKLKIPSRCHEIRCDYTNWYNQGRAFASKFETVELPNTIEKIGGFAFSAFGFTHITIPNSVTSIGNTAFGTLSNLNSIIIPDSVVSIEDTAFFGWNSNQTIKCRASSKPDGWSSQWDAYSYDGSPREAQLIWGYMGE